MRILIDIGHPGHVHLFRNLYTELIRKGYSVYFTTQDIVIVKHLLNFYGINYAIIGTKKNGLISKGFSMLTRTYSLIQYIRKKRIDFCLSSTPSLMQAAYFCRKPRFFYDDDDDFIEPLVVKTTHPFSNIVLSPNCTFRKSDKASFYKGYHELAYLHPNRFNPDTKVLEKAGLKPGQPFFILRFVALKGHHDVGHKGINLIQKRALIELLEPHGSIIITSENEIEPEFEKYRLPVPPEEIHSLMYFAKMFLGDSQTMTSEAAVLGVPALKCNSFARELSVPNELEDKYGLCYSYKPNQFDKFYQHIEQLLQKDSLEDEWRKKRENFLNDKIDVSAFFVWFIENYPESKTIMKENSDYQYNFK